MGADGEQGLNIFTTKYVLARPTRDPRPTTRGIDRVVAPRVFPHWTGNRVTAATGSSLSLKEGLDGISATRIRRRHPLARGHPHPGSARPARRPVPEDGGADGAPIRPASYAEINNFYTATVYNKGANHPHMMAHACSGVTASARHGPVFERHDGQAVTCDDFVAAMQDATQVDLASSAAGTRAPARRA